MPSIAGLAAHWGISHTEAGLLAAHALGVSRQWVIAHDRDPLPAEHAERLVALLEQRHQGVPIAYLTGQREFYGLQLTVTPAVLIPRPETELLVDLTLDALGRAACAKKVRILDLGTGSGAIALALAARLPDAEIWACDASTAALEVARENALRLGLNVRFLLSDWFSALSRERYDFILANPPYVAEDDPHLRQGDVRYEPRVALCAGDGLSAIRAIVSRAVAHLTEGGWLWVEHGCDQAASVRSLLASPDWTHTGSWRDLVGHERVTGARLQARAGARQGGDELKASAF